MRMDRRVMTHGSGVKTWAKYNAVSATVYADTNTIRSGYFYESIDNIYCCSSVSINQATGYFVYSGFSYKTLAINCITYLNNTEYWEVDQIDYNFVFQGKTGYQVMVYRHNITSSVVYSKGTTSYGTVTSTDANAYPENGYYDGYWYVLQ